MADRVLGLDIGASSVKVAQVLRHPDGRFTVEKQAARALPRGYVFDGRTSDADRGRVSSILADLVADAGFTTRDVIYGLNSSSAVFMEQITVPMMAPREVASALPAVIAAEYPTIASGDTQLSYTVVGETLTGDGERRLRVLVYSCLTAYTREVADIVTGAGLRVVGADLNALAALRATRSRTRGENLVDALIDIGASVTVVLIHHNGVPQLLTLDPDAAGDVATARIADALGIDESRDWDQAEGLKISDDSPVGLVAQARADYTKALASKLVTSLASFLDRSPDYDSLASLTLVGGGSLLHGLAHQLRAELGDQVPLEYSQLAEEIRGVDGAPVERHEHRSGGDYLVAIGLGTGRKL